MPTMTTPSLESRVDELLAGLAGSDMFGRQRYLDHLRDLGLDVVAVLLFRADASGHHIALALREVVKVLPTEAREKACMELTRGLRRDHGHAVRVLALATIDDCLRDLVGYIDWVIPIALDPSEPSDLRIRALKVLREASLTPSQARELVALLSLERLSEADLRSAVFSCLERHANKLPVKTTMGRLDPFLTHPEPAIRVHALDLLGSVGDLDAIEPMCLLPNTTEEIRRIQESIGRILLRPTNLLALRPEHFEQFIGHLLRKMGHEDVKRVGAPHDGGVDVISYYGRQNMMGPARERWIVQCKRWTTNHVDLPDVEALVATSRKHDAKHALLITTSDFTARARTYAEEHTAAIELVSGPMLLRLLGQLFGPDRYTIRSHD